nr:hypothetical protein CFP56_56588 [Quercus suber]
MSRPLCFFTCPQFNTPSQSVFHVVFILNKGGTMGPPREGSNAVFIVGLGATNPVEAGQRCLTVAKTPRARKTLVRSAVRAPGIVSVIHECFRAPAQYLVLLFLAIEPVLASVACVRRRSVRAS